MDNKILSAAINHYGPKNQLTKTTEEAGELIRAVSRVLLALNYEGKAITDMQKEYDNLAEEIADTEIMLAQIRLIIPGIHRDIETAKEAKLIRLEQKLKEGKGNE